jgi:hypothetical protein
MSRKSECLSPQRTVWYTALMVVLSVTIFAYEITACINLD